MIKKKDNILKTITIDRHNKTIKRLLEQHGEEIQQLKDRIVELEKQHRKAKLK